MKFLGKTLLAVALVSLTVACSQDKKKTDITAARPGDAGVRTSGAGTALTGSVGGVSNILNKGMGAISSSTSDADFTNKIKMFLSTNVNPDNVGDVSANTQAQTGVRFWLDVPVTAANGQVNLQASQLVIAVYDSLTQQYGSPITVKMGAGTLKQGTYSGNQLNLTFSDSYGEIMLTGSNQGNLLIGNIRYCNNVVMSAPSVTWGASCGDLGQFQINTQDAIRQQ